MMRLKYIFLLALMCLQCKKLKTDNFYELSLNNFDYESKNAEFVFIQNGKDTLNTLILTNPISIQDSIVSGINRYHKNWSCRLLSSKALQRQWSILDKFEQKCFSALVKEEKYGLGDEFEAIKKWSSVYSYGQWITNRDSVLWKLTNDIFKKFLIDRNNDINNDIIRLDSCEKNLYLSVFSEIEENFNNHKVVYLTLFDTLSFGEPLGRDYYRPFYKFQIENSGGIIMSKLTHSLRN
ncbi:MAG: hypothetical protein K9I85_15615 [Saprospiraceae bacterium]|nr:hypothetical protein [Saprospiraceae bacterium]